MGSSWLPDGDPPALVLGSLLKTAAEPLGWGPVPREQEQDGSQSYLHFSSPVRDFFLPWKQMEKQMIRMRGQHKVNSTRTQRRDRSPHCKAAPHSHADIHTHVTAWGTELKPCPPLLVNSLAAGAGHPREKKWDTLSYLGFHCSAAKTQRH